MEVAQSAHKGLYAEARASQLKAPEQFEGADGDNNAGVVWSRGH
jgi:hypothetical protein